MKCFKEHSVDFLANKKVFFNSTTVFSAVEFNIEKKDLIRLAQKSSDVVLL